MTPLGWILVILISAMIITLNIDLFTRLKHKGEEPTWINTLKEAGKTLKDPYKSENERMQLLSDQVSKLKKNNHPSDQDASDPGR